MTDDTAVKQNKKSLPAGIMYIACLLAGYLTSYGFTATYAAAPLREHYGDTVDFLIAYVYAFLGQYSFSFFLLWTVLTGFYIFMYKKELKKGVSVRILAAAFACILVAGKSYYETGTGMYLTGSLLHTVISVLSCIGFYIFFDAAIPFLFRLTEKGSYTGEKKHFFSEKPFLKAFLILAAVYVPFLILSYPGGICWDVIGQLEQVMGITDYSAHHPLAHTLIVGGLTTLGQKLFGNYEIGFYVYVVLQCVAFLATLAATIAFLAARRARPALLWVILVLYCITPMYTNLATTALKDVPFTCFVVLYIMGLASILEKPELLHNKSFYIVFVLVQTGTILMRNNGMPLVVLCGIGAFIWLFKKYKGKDKILSAGLLGVCSVVAGRLVIFLLMLMLSATPGGKGEMFSVPFQQTARYLIDYGTELSEAEREGIEGVFPGVEIVADSYNPRISDPVKALYDKEAGVKEILGYFKAWGIGLVKHPLHYAETFYIHIYGWITPSVENSLRYETDYEFIDQGLLFEGADKVMIFLYRFAGKFTPLAVLENIGVWTWLLALITFYLAGKKQGSNLVATLPFWVSLLICMASPCFFMHPRYAFPIVVGLPVFIGFILTGMKEGNTLSSGNGKGE